MPFDFPSVPSNKKALDASGCAFGLEGENPNQDGGGNAGIDVSSPLPSHAPELAAVAASSAAESNVKWRNFALSSIVVAIVLSAVNTR